MSKSEGPFAMVAGTSLNQPLHIRAMGVFIQNLTSQWVQVAEVGFIPPNTSGSVGLGGTAIAVASFTAPPGVNQPVAAAGQTCFFTYVDEPLPFVSGPTQGGTALAAVAQLERFVKATIPPSIAANAGRAILLTDYARDVWIDNGTQFWSVDHEVFDVKAFGAKGDSVTDDKPSIQAAINAAAGTTLGGIVFFPPGRYIISGTLTIPSRVTLQGSGVASAQTDATVDRVSWLQLAANANVDMVKNSDTVNGNSDIRIRDLSFHGNGTNQVAGVAIIHFTKVWYSDIENCYFRAAELTNRRGVFFDGASEQNYMRRCFFVGAGVEIQSSNAITLERCEITSSNTTRAIYVNGVCYSIHIRNCFCYISQNGIYFYNGVTQSSIEGCSIWNSQNDGIAFDTLVTRCVISGNTIKNSSLALAGTWAGLLLWTTCTDNVVVGNAFFDDQAGKTQGAAIRMLGSADWATIVGNNCRGNLNATAITIVGTRNRIVGNLGFNPLSTSIVSPAIAATGVAVTNTFGVDCDVYVTGAPAVTTTVAIDGITVEVLPVANTGTYRVYSGSTIALTYAAGAPTWVWSGD